MNHCSPGSKNSHTSILLSKAIDGFLTFKIAEGFKPPMHIQLEIDVADMGAQRRWGDHHLAGDLWNVQVRI